MITGAARFVAWSLLLCACGGSTSGGSAGTGRNPGGSDGGGAAPSGGASNGGAAHGGASSGGTSNGGVSNGGSGHGGALSGGASNGGASNGGAPNGLVSCDPQKVRCFVAPPSCGPMQVPSVNGNCYGPCVDIAQCACTAAAECPDSNQYTCIVSQKHCSPYLL